MKDIIRLSFVIYEDGNAVNGPIVNQQRLLYALHKIGYRIQVISLYHKSTPVLDRFKKAGITTTKYPAGRFTCDTVLWILKELEIFQPDIFIPDWIAPAAYAAKWLRETGVPTIGALRSDDSYFWALMDVFAGKKSGRWALSSVFCVSRQLENRLNQGLSNHTQSCFIPSGVPYPSSVQPKNPPVKMVYLGRIEIRQKQIIETTRAMCRAAREVEGTTGILIGNGPDEESVQSLIKKEGCENIIKLESAVPPQQLDRVLANFNAVILLSDYEGTPGSLMDGMANGLAPVCISCSGGINSLVKNGKTGLVVKDRKESFIQAIHKLHHESGLMQEISNNARSRILEEFTLDHTINRWEDLCSNLLSQVTARKPLRIPKSVKLPKLHPNLFGFDYRPPSRRKELLSKFRILLGAFRNTLIGRN